MTSESLATQMKPLSLPARRPRDLGVASLTKVQTTAVDALNGKISCVQRGYYQDPFILLLRPPTLSSPTQMSPLINKGYYARVMALETFTRAFLEHAMRLATEACTRNGQALGSDDPVANVLVLGAGLDSLYFRLADERRRQRQEGGSAQLPAFQCYEVDYPEVMQLKASLIARQTALSSLMGDAPAVVGVPSPHGPNAHSTSIIGEGSGGALSPNASDEPREGYGPVELPSVSMGPSGGAPQQGWSGCGYAMVGGDLGDTRGLEERLAAAGLDRSLPTLILAECVLVYLEVDESARLIEWASSRLPESVLISYDMIRPHDSFGKVMIANLKSRGLSLPGFGRYPDVPSQLRRMAGEGGWDRALAADLYTLYQHFLTPEQRKRAQQVEMLDEVEEWAMLMGHYCYVLGSKGPGMSSLFRDLPHFQHYEPPPQAPAEQEEAPEASAGAEGIGGGQTEEGQAGQGAPAVGRRAQEPSGVIGAAAPVAGGSRPWQRAAETTEL